MTRKNNFNFVTTLLPLLGLAQSLSPLNWLTIDQMEEAFPFRGEDSETRDKQINPGYDRERIKRIKFSLQWSQWQKAQINFNSQAISPIHVHKTDFTFHRITLVTILRAFFKSHNVWCFLLKLQLLGSRNFTRITFFLISLSSSHGYKLKTQNLKGSEVKN